MRQLDLSPPGNLLEAGEQWAQDAAGEARRGEIVAGLSDAYRLTVGLFDAHQEWARNFVESHGGVADIFYRDIDEPRLTLPIPEPHNFILYKDGYMHTIDQLLEPVAIRIPWENPRADTLPEGTTQEYYIRLSFDEYVGPGGKNNLAERRVFGPSHPVERLLEVDDGFPPHAFLVEQLVTKVGQATRTEEEFYKLMGEPAPYEGREKSDAPDRETEPRAYREWILAGTIRTALLALAADADNSQRYLQTVVNTIGDLSPDVGQAVNAYDRFVKLLTAYAVEALPRYQEIGEAQTTALKGKARQNTPLIAEGGA